MWYRQSLLKQPVPLLGPLSTTLAPCWAKVNMVVQGLRVTGHLRILPSPMTSQSLLLFRIWDSGGSSPSGFCFSLSFYWHW